MESKQETASVILKLMGLDHVPPQYHPVRDRQKVLSEDYLQKVASIGLRKKRSSHSHQHYSIEKEESDDVLKVVKTIRRDENHNPSKGNGKENLSLFETKIETMYILEGKVKVTVEESVGSFEIGAGDLVVFPKEMNITWKITEVVKKHYSFKKE